MGPFNFPLSVFINALKESLNQLTLIGKITLAPIIVLLFLIMIFSIGILGYPLMMFKIRYDKQLIVHTKKVQRIFYRGS